MQRYCPVCRIPLNPVTIKHRIQIDFCLKCRGIWFDKDELGQVQHHDHLPEKLLTGSASGQRDKILCESCDLQNERSARQCSRCGAALSFLCPVCRQQMQEVAVGNVLVDRCHSCQGVWLDGGELALLFNEFTQRKKAEVEQIRREGGRISGDLAAWAALDALDLLIWRPDLASRAGEAIADVPGAVVQGIGTAIDGVGHLPEMAGDMTQGTLDLAGGAAAATGEFISEMPEMAGDVASGAVEFAGSAADFTGDMLENVPEMAGAVAEAGASFIEMLFEIIGSIFDS